MILFCQIHLLVSKNIIKKFQIWTYLDLVYDFEKYDLVKNIDKFSDKIFEFSKYWKDNLGFKIKEISVVNGGSGYILNPIVEINSDSGTGAKALAFISKGKVNRICKGANDFPKEICRSTLHISNR